MSKAAELAALIGSGQAQGNKNLIINGAMQVAQRGTSSTASDYAALDRWRNSHGGGTVTQTQEALTGGDPYNDGHRNFLRATNTSAGSTAATDNLQIYQTIESQNLASSGWNSTSSSSFITLSAWVRSSLAGTYYVRLYIYDGNKNYAFPITLSANTWTKITKSIPGASGNTVNNDNGHGMFVNFAAHLGTDNTDSGFTINQWATFSSTSQAPDYAQNWRSTGSATFDITGVQLEVGEQATPFEHRSYGDELLRCQRYYEKKGQPSTSTTWAFNEMSVVIANSTEYVQGDKFNVEKRGDPTITIYSRNGTSGKISAFANGSDVTGTFATNARGATGFHAVQASSTSLTQGNGYEYGYTADAEL